MRYPISGTSTDPERNLNGAIFSCTTEEPYWMGAVRRVGQNTATGNNTDYSAKAGWDACTGWGEAVERAGHLRLAAK